MKDRQTTFSNAPNTLDDEHDIDWQPLYRALHESIEWTLDIASQLVESYPEEVEAIERVRAFARAKLAGRSAPVRLTDLLLTFSVLIAGIERDHLRPKKAPPLEAAFDRASERLAFGEALKALSKMFRIPAAPLPWMPPTVTRHCPGADADRTYHAPHIH